MPHTSLEACRSILSDALKLSRGNDLSSWIKLFQQEIDEYREGKADRMMTILQELAQDLAHYEHDAFTRDQDRTLLGEMAAMEKIREALDAIDNIERVMPWLKKA